MMSEMMNKFLERPKENQEMEMRMDILGKLP